MPVSFLGFKFMEGYQHANSSLQCSVITSLIGHMGTCRKDRKPSLGSKEIWSKGHLHIADEEDGEGAKRKELGKIWGLMEVKTHGSVSGQQSEKTEAEVKRNGKLSRLDVWLLVLAWVRISGSWDRAPCWALLSGLLEDFLSLCLSPGFHSVSLSVHK